MRFMVIVKATEDSEAGIMPSEELLTAMMKYNEELVKAGIMLAGDGLHPSSKGARVHFSGDKRTVIDGPFAETKELIAGYWIWQVRSLDEAIEWVKRCPNPMISVTQLLRKSASRNSAYAPKQKSWRASNATRSETSGRLSGSLVSPGTGPLQTVQTF
jgi:hypothetical protein